MKKKEIEYVFEKLGVPKGKPTRNYDFETYGNGKKHFFVILSNNTKKK
jgi:hypothetical protein